MEKTFEFEIQHQIFAENLESSISSIDIIEAIYKLMALYKKNFNVDLTADNFIYVREYDGNL